MPLLFANNASLEIDDHIEWDFFYYILGVNYTLYYIGEYVL